MTIYISIQSNHLIKFLQAGESTDNIDVGEYQSNSVNKLYVHRTLARWILTTCSLEIEKILNNETIVVNSKGVAAMILGIYNTTSHNDDSNVSFLISDDILYQGKVDKHDEAISTVSSDNSEEVEEALAVLSSDQEEEKVTTVLSSDEESEDITTAIASESEEEEDSFSIIAELLTESEENIEAMVINSSNNEEEKKVLSTNVTSAQDDNDNNKNTSWTLEQTKDDNHQGEIKLVPSEQKESPENQRVKFKQNNEKSENGSPVRKEQSKRYEGHLKMKNIQALEEECKNKSMNGVKVDAQLAEKLNKILMRVRGNAEETSLLAGKIKNEPAQNNDPNHINGEERESNSSMTCDRAENQVKNDSNKELILIEDKAEQRPIGQNHSFTVDKQTNTGHVKVTSNSKAEETSLLTGKINNEFAPDNNDRDKKLTLIEERAEQSPIDHDNSFTVDKQINAGHVIVPSSSKEERKSHMTGRFLNPFAETNDPKYQKMKVKKVSTLYGSASNESIFTDYDYLQDRLANYFDSCQASKDWISTIISSSTSEVLQEQKKEVSRIMVQRPKLGSILRKIELTRQDKLFFQERLALVSRIACSLASALGIRGRSTINTILYVSHYHDIALIGNAKLAKIKNIKELKKYRKEFSHKVINLYIDHPRITSQIIQNDTSAPDGSYEIVLQHHEIANNFGFPAKLPDNKIVPLAIILNISIDYAQHIIENVNWDLDDYIELARSQYSSTIFDQVIQTLQQIGED
jgi:hypothetical protein